MKKWNDEANVLKEEITGIRLFEAAKIRLGGNHKCNGIGVRSLLLWRTYQNDDISDACLVSTEQW